MDNGILICGNDLSLQRTREIVLKTATLPVSSVLGVSGLDEMLSGPAPELVVLCHTLSAAERAEVVGKIHRYWPTSKTLALTTLAESSDEVEDCDTFDAFLGPKALVDRVRQLTSTAELR